MSVTSARNRREILIIVFAALLWTPGTGGDSFLSDDIDHLTTWGIPPFAQVWQWFSNEYFHYYRPLTALLWNLEYAVWGLNPLGFQLVNLAMHTGCTLLVRELARQLFPGEHHIGLIAALLFLFLPHFLLKFYRKPQLGVHSTSRIAVATKIWSDFQTRKQ